MQRQRHLTSLSVARDSARRRVYLVPTAVIAACFGLHFASAQDAAPHVMIDVGDCVSLKSPGERLDCYERHVEAAKRPSEQSPIPATQTSAAPATPAPPQSDAVSIAPGPAAPTTAPASAATPAAAAVAATVAAAAAASSPQTAPAVTSVSAPAAPAPSTTAQVTSADNVRSNQSHRDAQGAPPEIVATVAELHETVPNAWLITLDNGQVWRQNIPQRFALKPGQRVTLRGTKWGSSYRLSAEALNGFIQVEQVH
jgi:hypothetical protein